MSCGSQHTAVITATGTAYCWGEGEWGALGNSRADDCYAPCQVSNLRERFIARVSAGARHTGFVSDTGECFMAGSNDSGQLGLGSKSMKEL